MIGVLIAAALSALPRVPSEPGRVVSLDGEWDFALFATETNAAPATAGKIEVPSSWEMRGYGTPLYDEKISGEAGRYRRRFDVPREWEDMRVFLRFDGVQFGAAVKVNGLVAGDFTSSFNAHVLDVTDFVRRDAANDLEVFTHGNPKGASFDTNDDWTLHGIHRSVRLFALPSEHVRDWRISTKVVDDTSAKVTVNMEVAGGCAIPQVSLFAPDGRKVVCIEPRSRRGSLPAGLVSVSQVVQFVVTNACLWTAETPNLYMLEIVLPSQTVREKVGLREVTWNECSLMVNGRPVELRGVNHHDISPTNGRAVTAAEQRRDVELIRAANCNFIRTSHYPPSEALLDACDELGVYVMDEIPFGHGNRFLSDASYGPILMECARLTLERDANRASVIAWSVGNENPITDITVAASDLVRSLDATRPRCFPMQPNYFMNRFAEKGLYEFGDLINWHYPLICGTPDELRTKWFGKFDRPSLSGEFAHANGLDHGAIETYMAMVRSIPSYIGGAVWMFHDQGLLRRADELPDDRRDMCAWLDETQVYDSHGRQGTDGIVYSDRTPQIDYFEVKKAYSPIILGDVDLAAPVPGSRLRYELPVENHFDFLSLDAAATGTWSIVAAGRRIVGGALSVSPVPPRGKGMLEIDAGIPDFGSAAVRWLEASFASKRDGREIYRRTYPLGADISVLASAKGRAPVKDGEKVSSAAYTFRFDTSSGKMWFADSMGRVLIDGPLLARVDRRSSISKDFSMAKTNPWRPRVLAPDSVSVRSLDAEALELDAVYSPTNEAAVATNAALNAHLVFAFGADRINLSYRLSQNCARKVVEMGLALPLAAKFSRFDWVGLGPYEAYPGAAALSDFGVWSLDARDLYFPGNRRDVRAIRVSAAGGEGVLALPAGGSGDFSFEHSEDGGLLLGANVVVSCRACRFMVPPGVRTVEAGEVLEGAFSIVPAAAVSDVAARVFGDTPAPVPFAPFRKVYDR